MSFSQAAPLANVDHEDFREVVPRPICSVLRDVDFGVVLIRIGEVMAFTKGATEAVVR